MAPPLPPAVRWLLLHRFPAPARRSRSVAPSTLRRGFGAARPGHVNTRRQPSHHHRPSAVSQSALHTIPQAHSIANLQGPSLPLPGSRTFHYQGRAHATLPTQSSLHTCGLLSACALTPCLQFRRRQRQLLPRRSRARRTGSHSPPPSSAPSRST